MIKLVLFSTGSTEERDTIVKTFRVLGTVYMSSLLVYIS